MQILGTGQQVVILAAAGEVVKTKKDFERDRQKGAIFSTKSKALGA
jgi:hypothetical protein